MATASSGFQVFVKPTGAACNLNCSYCYYLQKADLYPKTLQYRMPDDLLETYIGQHIAASPTSLAMFAWHGGEPTLLGIDYFRKILEIQRKYRIAGQEIANGIQTNGTLVDEEWCRFFAAEKFFVGVSLDGPAALHDGYRVTKSGKATHAEVMRAIRLLEAHGNTLDILCVVHRANVAHPLEVYRFFREIGQQYLVFLPLVRRSSGGDVTAETVPAKAYGDFLCTIFDEWLRHDVGKIHVQAFDEATRVLLGHEQMLCVNRKTCGVLPVLEHTGDWYCCDHFVNREHCLGNIRDIPLTQVLETPALREFGRAKWDSLPVTCRQCRFVDFCNGGCPKDRFVRTRPGAVPSNYLCEGYKQFYTYVRPGLRRLAAFMQSGRPLTHFTGQDTPETSAIMRSPGRNDPCPCGSGKKYKKCCFSEVRAGERPGTFPKATGAGGKSSKAS